MYRIIRDIVMEFAVLRMSAEQATNGTALLGVANGAYGIQVVWESEPAQEVIDALDAMLAAYNSLVVQADKTTITADDVDEATIRVATAQNVAYEVYANGYIDVYASGTAASEGGEATLIFTAPAAGTYQINVVETGGAHASGTISIEAV